jgi:hypothetical protein
MQSSNVALYEQTVHELARDDTAPLRAHHMVYRVLTDTAVMDHFLAKWEAHPVRFENRHPYLWRILDGYEHRPQLEGHQDRRHLEGYEHRPLLNAHEIVGSAGSHSLIAGANSGLAGNKGGLPGIGDGNNGGAGGGINPDFGGGGSGGIGTLSVPEPTAIALLGPGIVGVVLAVARCAKKATKCA